MIRDAVLPARTDRALALGGYRQRKPGGWRRVALGPAGDSKPHAEIQPRGIACTSPATPLTVRLLQLCPAKRGSVAHAEDHPEDHDGHRERDRLIDDDHVGERRAGLAVEGLATTRALDHVKQLRSQRAAPPREANFGGGRVLAVETGRDRIARRR